MGDLTIGLLHPGEMGAAVGQCLAGAGRQVLWAPDRDSPGEAGIHPALPIRPESRVCT